MYAVWKYTPLLTSETTLQLHFEFVEIVKEKSEQDWHAHSEG